MNYRRRWTLSRGIPTPVDVGLDCGQHVRGKDAANVFFFFSLFSFLFVQFFCASFFCERLPVRQGAAPHH